MTEKLVEKPIEKQTHLYDHTWFWLNRFGFIFGFDDRTLTGLSVCLPYGSPDNLAFLTMVYTSGRAFIYLYSQDAHLFSFWFCKDIWEHQHLINSGVGSYLTLFVPPKLFGSHESAFILCWHRSPFIKALILCTSSMLIGHLYHRSRLWKRIKLDLNSQIITLNPGSAGGYHPWLKFPLRFKPNGLITTRLWHVRRWMLWFILSFQMVDVFAL